MSPISQYVQHLMLERLVAAAHELADADLAAQEAETEAEILATNDRHNAAIAAVIDAVQEWELTQ